LTQNHLIQKITAYRYLLILVLILAAVLRLYKLGVPSLWWDEMGQALVAEDVLVNTLKGVQHHHGAVPLDYLITAVMVRLSRADFVLRLPAAIWGILSVYWIFRVGRLIHSERVGILAAFLLAINPFHIRYSQELRFYALFILLTLISSEIAWRAYHADTRKRWLLYACVGVLMVYTHYFGTIVILLHGLGMLLVCQQEKREHRHHDCARRLKHYLASAGVVFLLFLPWLVFDALQESGLPNATTPGWSLTIISDTLHAFSGYVDGYWGIWLIVALVGLGVVWARSKALGLLFIVWLTLPLVAIVFLDQHRSYFYNPRQDLFALPPYLLLVSAGIVGIAERVAAFMKPANRRYAQAAGIGVMVALFAVATWPSLRNYYVYQGRHENWKEMAVIVEKNIHEGDVLLFLENAPRITYYLSPPLRARARQVKNVEELTEIYETGKPIWLITSPIFIKMKQFDPVRAWLKEHHPFKMALGTGLTLYFFQKGGDDQVEVRMMNLQLPDRPDIWGFYGDAVRKLRRWDRALEAHEKAASLAVDPEEKAKYWMEAGYDAVFAGDVPRAIADLDRAAQLSDDPEIGIRKGMALLRADRPEEAVAVLEHTRAQGGEGYWLFFFLGKAYYDSGDYLRAADAYQQAIQLRPKAHEVRFFIAEAYRHGGNKKLARYWYRDYLKHAPNGQFAQKASAFLEEDF